jgi:putative DNA primase/helicase
VETTGVLHKETVTLENKNNTPLNQDKIRAAINGAQSIDWLDPEPLPGALPAVPPFDESLLPEALRPWVADIADRAQAPMDFPAASAIVVLSSAVGRRLGIRPKRHDDWLIVPNLWGMIVGPPGMLKSPMLQEAVKPLMRLETRASEDFERLSADYELEQQILQAERKRIINDASKPNAKNREEFISQLRGLDEKKAPTRTRYITNDPSIEKLGELLNQNPGGMLLWRDEIYGFLANMERQGHENDRAFYLESWNGYSRYTWDRVGRGTIDVNALCIAILGSITPGPLGAYLRDTFSGERADGFVQRFQMSVYPDSPPNWTNVDRPPDIAARRRAFELFERFVSFVGDLRGGEIASLRFDDEAQEFFDAWRGNLEAKIRDPEEHPVMVAHLTKYRKLMPSLALVLHLCDSPPTTPANLDATERAAAWCDYLEPHARRIYHSLTARVDTAARLLGEKIKRRKLNNPFSIREVYRHEWTGLREPRMLRAPWEFSKI